MDSREIVDVIIGVVFMATFIGIFFFTYGAYIEKRIAKEQIEGAVDNLMQDIKYFAGDQISPVLGLLKAPEMTEEDNKVRESNKALIKKVIMLITIFFVLGLGLAFSLSWFKGVNFMASVKHNIIILIFIALTEFSFLTFIAAEYRSLDPNIVKKTILHALLK